MRVEEGSEMTNRMRSLREDCDYTQSQIAAVLHVVQKTYSDYELGKTRIPIDSAMLLADYYGVSLDYLCGRTDRNGEGTGTSVRK